MREILCATSFLAPSDSNRLQRYNFFLILSGFCLIFFSISVLVCLFGGLRAACSVVVSVFSHEGDYLAGAVLRGSGFAQPLAHIGVAGEDFFAVLNDIEEMLAYVAGRHVVGH